MREMPDPATTWYVDAIIRNGRWIVICCPFCSESHEDVLGPWPSDGLREAPCEVRRPDLTYPVFYSVRNAEVGFLPGLLSTVQDAHPEMVVPLC